MRHYNAIENERYRLDMLDKARTRIIQKQLVRNEAHNEKYTSYRDITPLDLELVRVQAAKVPNKSLAPQFTVNKDGRPFVVLRVKGPSVVILDDSRNLMWTEQMNNLRLFNNGNYNTSNLERYKFPIDNGMNAVYIPQNKGVRFNKTYQKESFDPASVGGTNHLISDDQKIPVDYIPFSPYDIKPSDKPVPITDYPLIRTAVTFLQGHLPIIRSRTRRQRKRSVSSSDSQSELSDAESSEEEDEYLDIGDFVAVNADFQPDVTPDRPSEDDNNRRGGHDRSTSSPPQGDTWYNPTRRRSTGDAPTRSQDSGGLRRKPRRNYQDDSEAGPSTQRA